jgi:hypothetical protein
VAAVSAPFFLYALLFATLCACDVGTCGAPRLSRPTLWRFLNCPSLIERAFLLWCLGNNVLEYLPKGEDEDENARVAVYCKEVLRTPD